VGDALYGGAQAAGVDIGVIEAGDAQTGGTPRADLLVLDDDALLLAARAAENLLDTFLFAATRIWCARHGERRLGRARFHHRDKERIASRYREVVARLTVGD